MREWLREVTDAALLSAGKRAHDHDLLGMLEVGIHIVGLSSVDEELDVPANPPLLIDDPKAQPWKLPIKVPYQAAERGSVRAHRRRIRGVVPQRTGNEDAHR